MVLKVKSVSKKKPRVKLSKKYIPVSKKRRLKEKNFWHEVDESFFNFGKYGKRK